MDRQARLEEVIQELERRFGPGVVYRLSQARPKLGARVVSTGSLSLDLATGIGGVPRGRITTVDGPESSGKTTLAYHVLANAQTEGGLAAFVDAEQSADAEELRRCGVDLADLVLGLPMSAAEALEMAEILARSAALDAVVVSDLPRPYPSALLAEASRRIAAALAGTPTALVLVGLAGRSRGALPLASLSLFLRPTRLLVRPGGEIMGLRVRAEVAKNRLAPPGAATEFEVVEGRGIYRPAELLDLGLRFGLIELLPQGAAYAGHLLGLGRARALSRLERDGALAACLEAELRRTMGLSDDGRQPHRPAPPLRRERQSSPFTKRAPSERPPDQCERIPPAPPPAPLPEPADGPFSPAPPPEAEADRRLDGCRPFV